MRRLIALIVLASCGTLYAASSGYTMPVTVDSVMPGAAGGYVVSTAKANTFTVGGQQINNASAAVVPLTIKGVSNQSANLLNLTDNTNTVVASVSATGGIAQDSVSVSGAVFEARISGTSGVAVTTTDVATTASVWLVPYNGNRVALYNGTRWVLYTLANTDTALGTLTANKNYDVFVYWSGGTLAPAGEFSAAWTTDTTRADALGTQDGVLVKSSDHTRRYAATIRTISTTQTTDTARQRFIANYYNAVDRTLALYGSGMWTCNTATYAAANSGNADGASHSAVGFVIAGTAQAYPVEASLSCSVYDTAAATWRNCAVALGLDSTSASSGTVSLATTIATISHGGGTAQVTASAQYVGTPGIGYHALNWLEATEVQATTCTWIGSFAVGGADYVETKSGITGNVKN